MTRRWVGGVFGNTVGTDSPFDAITGVFDTSQQYYIRQEGGWVDPLGHDATGGTINDYQVGPAVYRSHTFVNGGTFVINTLSNTYPAGVDVMVIGGGGGGGSSTSNSAGGGGAGGMVISSGVPVSAQTYNVFVGGGGASNPENRGSQGGRSYFGTGGSPDSGPSPQNGITGLGGGGGGAQGVNGTGLAGGSGGGGCYGQGPGGAGQQPSVNHGLGGSHTNYGYRGGNASNPGSAQGSGGGGAGGQGPDVGGTAHVGTPGGGSRSNDYEFGVAVHYGPGGGADGYYSNGTGGNPRPAVYANAGDANTKANCDGAYGYGGGGGGNAPGGNSGPAQGGNGGSGRVVVRYRIGNTQTGTRKATGGNVSFYNGKVIHVFKESGSLQNTSGAPLTVDYIVIGGGGGGGAKYHGAGGGAGGVRTSHSGLATPNGHTADSSYTIGSGFSATVTIGAGGKGGEANVQWSGGSNYNGTGMNGGNSSFGPITATGGGFGGTYPNQAGQPGGSGGGGGQSSGGGGNGITNQGKTGGTGGGGSWAGAGGGGGYGGVGEAGTPGNGNSNNNAAHGGNGGLGLQLPTYFRNPQTRLGALGPNGEYYWFAGGGGGSCNPASKAGRGGGGNGVDGGGGSGVAGPPYAGGGNGTNAQGFDGHTNTGGGGGGSERSQPSNFSHDGGKGGSGIVIVSYPE